MTTSTSPKGAGDEAAQDFVDPGLIELLRAIENTELKARSNAPTLQEYLKSQISDDKSQTVN